MSCRVHGKGKRGTTTRDRDFDGPPWKPWSSPSAPLRNGERARRLCHKFPTLVQR